MLRLLFIAMLFPLCSISQIDQFYGTYFMGNMNEEMQLVVPYNCWTELVDEVAINETGDPNLPLELVFNSFHAEALYGFAKPTADSTTILELINPDAETVEVRTFILSAYSDGIVVLSEENAEVSYFLVQVGRDDLYTLIPCPEEEYEVEER
ncbi:MAG: hypothetical protein A3D92_02160 [Bacteroidetes bacterium RIFCSPHIGHO2_02_FULL_44_7]|nr:MAG: hypothetical protein A3D92_02160 [Bacteroidetes bacterium RIFCSPHIGHO2_02_FULL_44_7]